MLLLSLSFFHQSDVSSRQDLEWVGLKNGPGPLRKENDVEEKFTFRRSCGLYPCLAAGSDSYPLEKNLRAGLGKVSWELDLPK